MRISVWDDDTHLARQWRDDISLLLDDDSVTVEAPDAPTIEGEIRSLHNRRRAYLERAQPIDEAGDSSLDHTDILIVDNDLFKLRQFGDFSAEMVAMYARAYTTCGYIVILNVNPDVDFDLSLLGHPYSKADLHINDRFVADVGLWLACPKEQGVFRPWHWPLLRTVPVLYQARVSELSDLLVNGNGNVPILEHFGFDAIARNRLSRSARAFLHPRISVEKVTFLDFIGGNVAAVSTRDGAEIGRRADMAKIARLCAHRLSTWLARLVLGPQDILVDLPHMVERLPFLMPVDWQDVAERWNFCVQMANVPVGQLSHDPSPYGFGRAHWFDRPVFWWDKLDTDENFERLIGSINVNPLNLVFCEDSSAFHASADCRRFVAAHHSASDDRFIRWFEDSMAAIKYGPQSRLAM